MLQSYRQTACKLAILASQVAFLLGVLCESALPQVTPWVDITLRNGHLFVDSEIAGIPGYSLVDTGAEINGINERFINANSLSFRKGDEIKILGAFGASYRDTYREIPVQIFGTVLDFTNLTDLDLGSPDLQLILGAGFLKLLVFQIDYPNERMRAMSREGIDLKKLRNVDSKKELYGSSPIVKVRLNDEKDVWLMMDTGNSGGVLLDRKIAKKQGWLKRFASETGESQGVVTTGRMERFNLESLEIGGFKIENPIVSVPADGEEFEYFRQDNMMGTKLKTRQRKAQGILGYDVLKHFILTIDYRKGYIHMEPGTVSTE